MSDKRQEILYRSIIAILKALADLYPEMTVAQVIDAMKQDNN